MAVTFPYSPKMCLIKKCSHCGIKIGKEACYEAYLFGFCPLSIRYSLADFCKYYTPRPAEHFSRHELRSIATILIGNLNRDVTGRNGGSDILLSLQSVDSNGTESTNSELQTFDELSPGGEHYACSLGLDSSLPEPQTFNELFPDGEPISEGQFEVQSDIGELRLDGLETDEDDNSEIGPQTFDELFPEGEPTIEREILDISNFPLD